MLLPQYLAMTLVCIWMPGVLLFLRGARAQAVTQPDSHRAVAIGAPLELRCKYSSSLPSYLFWYMRSPSQGLQFLLKSTLGNERFSGSKGFEAELRQNEKSFLLRKPSAHWSDAAEYFCALTATVPRPSGGAAHKPPATLLKPLRICWVVFRKLTFSVQADGAMQAESWEALRSCRS
uniref:Ig-like domain-containing protein n=1 Tax=Oryctolagus cuniculus TaxID=9986 RepID=A0A5F9DH67_RABIT